MGVGGLSPQIWKSAGRTMCWNVLTGEHPATLLLWVSHRTHAAHRRCVRAVVALSPRSQSSRILTPVPRAAVPHMQFPQSCLSLER